MKYGRKLMLVKDESVQLPDDCISAPDEAIAAVKEYLETMDREVFIVVALDTRNHVVGINVVSIGALDSSIVHPREVFKFAILANASALILIHNHPSGDPEPSNDDKVITKRLDEAGKILGIDIADHIITGFNGRFVSMKAAGLF